FFWKSQKNLSELVTEKLEKILRSSYFPAYFMLVLLISTHNPANNNRTYPDKLINPVFRRYLCVKNFTG
ncbi:MAG: hypothetical protein O4859_19520, partial [Trichodesmium sp. St18_bin1]|nr:hypothetical protein [Trichodesmium sp. St18_bin1]